MDGAKVGRRYLRASLQKEDSVGRYAAWAEVAARAAMDRAVKRILAVVIVERAVKIRSAVGARVSLRCSSAGS